MAAGARGREIEVLLDKQLALLIRHGRVRRVIAVSTGAPGLKSMQCSAKSGVPPGHVFASRNSGASQEAISLPPAIRLLFPAAEK